MRLYRAYFVDSAGHIIDVDTLIADSDVLAIEAARRLLLETTHSMIEVWDRARRVGTVDAKNRQPIGQEAATLASAKGSRA